MIDKAGLKGKRIGDAEISTHHANFFINHGNAKAIDIASLIRLSRKTIYEKFGIMLELEIKTIGFKSSDFKNNFIVTRKDKFAVTNKRKLKPARYFAVSYTHLTLPTKA